MADIKKVISIDVEDNASGPIKQISNNLETLDTTVNDVTNSTEKLTSTQSNNTKGVLDNGGAMGLLNAVTGGYAQTVKDAVEASQLFSKEGKIGTAVQAAYTTVVGASTGAMKAFRIALAATGIGLIVVALGLLIANFDKVQEFVGKAIDKFKGLGEGAKLLISVLFPIVGVVRLITAALEKMGVIDDDITKAAKKNAEERIKSLNKEETAINEKYTTEIRLAKAAGKDTVELEKQKRAAILLTLKALNDAERARVMSGEATQDEIKRWNDRQAQIKGVILDGKVAEIEAETAKNARLAQIQKDADAKAKAERDRVAAKKKKDKEDEDKRQFEAAMAGAEAGRKFEEEQQKKFKENQKIQEEEDDDELYASVQKKVKEVRDREAEQRAADEADLQFQLDKDNAIASSQENLSNIINGLQDSGLAKTKAGQAVSKAIALTQIGIDSAVALSKASTLANAEGVAAQLAFPLVPGIGTIARVASYVSTGLQVFSNIRRAKALLSGGGGSGTGGSGSGGGGASIASARGGTGGSTGAAAQFNIVGQSSTNQLAETIAGRQQQPIRTYVVGSDVSTQQALDRARVQNATFL